MGLDITAYSRLKHVGMHEKDPELNEGEPGGVDDWCYYDGHVQAFAYDCFPQSYRGIPVIGKKGEFVLGGCYETTPETETIAFQAGSYGGYSAWRSDLAAQFNPAPITLDLGRPVMAEPDPALPFYELIWFADNEGSIGPEAAADLLADFRECAAARYVMPDPSEGAWRKDGNTRYQLWTRACELAADGGLIRFH